MSEAEFIKRLRAVLFELDVLSNNPHTALMGVSLLHEATVKTGEALGRVMVMDLVEGERAAVEKEQR